MFPLAAIDLPEPDLEQRARGRDRLRIDRRARSRHRRRRPRPPVELDAEPIVVRERTIASADARRLGEEQSRIARLPGDARRGPDEQEVDALVGRLAVALVEVRRGERPDRRPRAELDRAGEAAEDLILRIDLAAVEVAADHDAPRMSLDEGHDLEELCRADGAVEGGVLDAVAGVDVGVHDDEGAVLALDLDDLEALAAEVLALGHALGIPAEAEAFEAARPDRKPRERHQAARRAVAPRDREARAPRAVAQGPADLAGPGLLDHQDVEIRRLEARHEGAHPRGDVVREGLGEAPDIEGSEAHLFAPPCARAAFTRAAGAATVARSFASPRADPVPFLPRIEQFPRRAGDRSPVLDDSRDTRGDCAVACRASAPARASRRPAARPRVGRRLSFLGAPPPDSSPRRTLRDRTRGALWRTHIRPPARSPEGRPSLSWATP